MSRKISVMLPVFISKTKNISDTQKCIKLMRECTNLEFELVIVETCSQYFIDDADIYVYEKNKTNPNTSINRGFKACSGDYVVFIGNDVCVNDLWLECMLECFNKKEDCGLASLGNNENGDFEPRDEIVEKEYFSVCMMRKEDAWFDDNYKNMFNDTDLMFRIIVSGKKLYKNLNCIVYHEPHSTYGKYGGNKESFIESRNYFRNKYKEYIDDPYYIKFSGLDQI